MLCEFELSRLQMYKKYGTSDGDDKILRDMQKFETNEFDLCGLHCIYIYIYIYNTCSYA